METVDLEDNPTFDALSYTWGNPITMYERPAEISATEIATEFNRLKNDPAGKGKRMILDVDSLLYLSKHSFIPYESVDWNAERQFPISCDDATLHGTENLVAAMQFLRRIAMRDVKFPQHLLNVYFRKPPSRLIWIDALCINQDDLEERSAQVTNMSRIFGSAQNIFGWLGPADSLSKLGVDVLLRLTSKIIKNPEFESSFGGSLYGCGIDIQEQEWLAVFALLQRHWFRRVWIVQEAIFAKELTIICGAIIFKWHAIEPALRFISSTRLDEKIHEMVRSLSQGKPLTKFHRRVQESGVMTIQQYTKVTGPIFEDFSVRPKTTYEFVEGVRWVKTQLWIPGEPVKSEERVVLQSKEDGSETSESTSCYVMDLAGLNNLRLSSTKRPFSFLVLLSTFRSCAATDPRDKVFAFLDIALKGNSAAQDSMHQLKPNYLASVQDIYIAAAKFILQTSKTLSLLSHVQDPSLTKISGLPSWVPDFSVELGRLCLGSEEAPYWLAFKDDNERAFHITDTNTLELGGFMVDTISEIASPKGCYFLNTARLALKTPSWYLSDGMNEPATIGYKPHFSNDPDRGPLSIAIFEDSQIGMITRVEALWRTLTADHLYGQHPAPVIAGFGFSDWIGAHIDSAANLFTTIQNNSCNFDGVQYGKWDSAQAKMMEKMEAWKELDRSECSAFYTLEELLLAKDSFADPEESTHQARMDTTKGRGIDLNAGGIRFLPDAARLKTFVNYEAEKGSGLSYTHENVLKDHENARLTVFEARMRDVKTGRRMFRTKGNYLGMGTSSVEEGDEVWALKGGSVPLVLRKVEPGLYRLIGEAYIHGVMNGEDVKKEKTFMKIVLQ